MAETPSKKKYIVTVREIIDHKYEVDAWSLSHAKTMALAEKDDKGEPFPPFESVSVGRAIRRNEKEEKPDTETP